jgi:hypothetical protein
LRIMLPSFGKRSRRTRECTRIASSGFIDESGNESWSGQRVFQIAGRCKRRRRTCAGFEAADACRRRRNRKAAKPAARSRNLADRDGHPIPFARFAPAGSERVYRAVVPSRSTSTRQPDQDDLRTGACGAGGNAVKPGVCKASAKSGRRRHTNCRRPDERDFLWHGGWLLAPLTVPLGLRPAVVSG